MAAMDAGPLRHNNPGVADPRKESTLINVVVTYENAAFSPGRAVYGSTSFCNRSRKIEKYTKLRRTTGVAA